MYIDIYINPIAFAENNIKDIVKKKGNRGFRLMINIFDAIIVLLISSIFK